MLTNLHRLYRRLLAHPPTLDKEVTMDTYRDFMMEETFFYSKRYAKQRVTIHNPNNLAKAIKQRGAILAFMHYGSFFLFGGAIRHQLQLPYTAIASRRNLSQLSPADKKFWQGVHRRSGELYGQPLFFSDEKVSQSVRWLEQPSHLLGVALDVHELDYPREKHSFQFLGREVFLPDSPSRLAKIAQVPMVPTLIRFDERSSTHHLHLYEPVRVESPNGAIQQVLSQLEGWIEADPSQQFFDIAQAFSTP